MSDISDKSREGTMALLTDSATVHTSDNGGATWEPVKLLGYFDKLFASFKGFISALIALLKSLLSIYSDDHVTDIAWSAPNRLYIATKAGNVYVSESMGRTFALISVGIADGDIFLTAGGVRIWPEIK